LLIALARLLAGCGGTSGTGPGSDSGGLDGRVGLGGTGGVAGQGNGGAGGAGALPRCAVATTTDAAPRDDAGNVVDCNAFGISGPWCQPEPFMGDGDAGVALDGGALEDPAGGTILDGDYDLIRYRTTFTTQTRRTIRIFGGVTYIQWAVGQENASVDGGVAESRLDTAVASTGNTLEVLSVDCGNLSTKAYGFTVSGNDLTLFNIQSTSPLTGNVYTYRRTCSR
jgi:hypothetical protein